MNTRYTELGQNRIDYIVYHNTIKATELLYDLGFEPPEDPEDLVEAIKELVREKGQTIIQALLNIHPDKKAILKVASPQKLCSSCKTAISNPSKSGCKSCKINALNEDSFTADAIKVDDNTSLEVLIKKYNANPSDKELEKEIETLWNKVRSTTEGETPNTDVTTEVSHTLLTKKELLVFSSIFTAGLLMGIGLSFSKNS